MTAVVLPRNRSGTPEGRPSGGHDGKAVAHLSESVKNLRT
jgi:hypothetical protein